MTSRRWVPFLSAAAMLAACDRGEPGRVHRSEEPAVVAVTSVGTAAGTLSFPAQVVASQEVELATRASGVIRRVTVDVGSRVRPGQLLVDLEAGDVAAGVAAAEAGAVQARRAYERIAALEADGAATGQELDDAEARLAMAQAGVRQARTQLGYVHLAAPIAGVVTERRVDPGDLVMPGQPALRIVSTSGVEIRADLPAEHARLVSPGATVTVIVPETGERAPARVTHVVPALEGQSRRFRVEAALVEAGAAASLLPGSFVRLEVETPDVEARSVPVDAVVRRGQLAGVYVLDGDTLRLRWVRLGEPRGEEVEILAGLAAGARVVRHPAPDLFDGRPAREAR